MYEIIIGRSEKEKKTLGLEGTVFLGKHYVQMGNIVSLSNKIYMDVSRSHVLFVCGKRGSGKSYSLGVIAEEMCNLPEEVSKRLAILIFDTMGIYWTMKYPNDKDEDLLLEWGLPRKPLDIHIYTPAGFYEQYKQEGIPTNFKFTISPFELEIEDWCTAFDVSLISQEGILIDIVLSSLKKKGEFNLDDVVKELEITKGQDEKVKAAVINRFNAAQKWGLFDIKSTRLRDILQGGKTTVLDISCYNNWTIKCLVVGLVCRKLMLERMASRKKEELVDVERGFSYFSNPLEEANQMPMIWLFIDECLPYNAEIITSKNHTAIGDIVHSFEMGEKVDVWAFNEETKQYGYYPVEDVYRRGKRRLIKIITETGRDLISTPNHRILTKKGFVHSNLAVDVGVPAVYHYDQNISTIKARLLGHIFGDGWLANNLSVGFSGNGCEEDLLKIKDDLFALGLSSGVIYSRTTKSKICDSEGKIIEVDGLSQSFGCSRKVFRYFKEIGAPVGIKALNKVEVPDWIIGGDDKVKSEFLSALFASDGTALPIARNHSDYNPIRFSFNKSELLKKEAYIYVNQLINLLGSLGIKSKFTERKGNIRKDGTKTIQLVITIDKQSDNMILYLSKVGYRYCKRKEIEGKKWLSYLLFRKKLKQNNIKLRDKAIELHKSGLGKTKIAKLLGIKDYVVREWIYFNRSVGLSKSVLGFNVWIKTRYKNETIFERIIDKQDVGEEDVFDLAVERVHNFVSNGVVVHNCHEFLPREGKTLATDALVQILREGRQPGVSLAMATQQPGQIHTDVITQTDIVISHRLTAKRDVEALNAMMQTYTTGTIQKYLNMLPREIGSAVILDDNSERLYPMKVRPRFSWHGGEAPRAIRAKPDILK